MNKFLLLMIVMFPLGAFLLNGLFGRWLKELGGWISVTAMACSAMISLKLLTSAWSGELSLPIETGPVWEWIHAGDLQISVGFHYDELTAVMCAVVTFVGSLVFLYSIGYMRGDPGFNRFFAYLSLFAFAMLILILGDSFPLLFVGWEGVGLCSYLLIGYYLDMRGAPDAGKKAFIVNRVGDAGFLLAMFLIYRHCGTLNIAETLRLAPQTFAVAGSAITAITLLLLLGCSGKSAQIPLFVWLPDAMAGPTPVSALIHAATMVTAGVYLVARTSGLFVMAPAAMQTMAVVGGATAFVAATIAMTQRDIKKVLAYSTISQLGYMFMACGVGAFSAGIFHVVTHAFFKGCLFLGAGAVIHAVSGTQDLFMMGGLRKKIPAVWLTYFAACLAISGVPFTAGFFSKDEILWRVFSASHPVLYLLGMVTALLTVLYSFRALFLAFHGENREPAPVRSHIHSPDWTMTAALVILAVGSLGVGFLNVPEGLANRFGWGERADFERFLSGALKTSAESPVLKNAEWSAHHDERNEISLTIASSLLALVGIGLSSRYFLRRWPDSADAIARRFSPLYQISFCRWWWDDLYNFVFAGGLKFLSRFATALDRWLIDGILHTIGKIAREAGRTVRHAQMGQTQAYALAVLIGANLLLLAVLLW